MPECFRSEGVRKGVGGGENAIQDISKTNSIVHSQYPPTTGLGGGGEH